MLRLAGKLTQTSRHDEIKSININRLVPVVYANANFSCNELKIG